MSPQEKELWQTRYEQLRQQALDPAATLTQDRWGLSLLLRKGIAIWMRAWQDPSTGAEQTAGSTNPVALGGVPAVWQQQATLLLANMALSHYPSASPCHV
jgi:hypothetical protein